MVGKDKKRITVTLEKDIVVLIDSKKRSLSRSNYVANIISEYLERGNYDKKFEKNNCAVLD